MSSTVKIKNVNGKTLSVTNNDGNTADIDVSYYTTVADLTAATGVNGSLAILTDVDRGGQFVYDSTATDNGGTVFGNWVRQYDGAISVKWFGDNYEDLESGWSLSNEFPAEASISKTSDKTVKVSKLPTGIKDGAVGGSFSVGYSTEANTQVSGYSSTSAMADYANRDSVALFSQNNSAPAFLETANTTFTTTSVTSADFSGLDIKAGMNLEVFSPTRYVCRVESFSGTTITVEAWYEVGTANTGTPANGNTLFIDRFTKIWGMNSNIYLPAIGDANSGTGLEIGVITDKAGTGAGTVGVDVVKLSGEAFTGYKARGGLSVGYGSEDNTTGFQSQDSSIFGFRSLSTPVGYRAELSATTGFQAEGCVEAFEAINPSSKAFSANISGVDKFKVNSIGQISGSFFGFQVVSATSTLSIDSVFSLVTLGGATVTLPSATGSAGKVMIVSNVSGSNIVVVRNAVGETLTTGTARMVISDNNNWNKITFE